MAGAKLDFDHKDVSAKIGAAIQGLDNPGPLFQIIIEYLTRVHRQRFRNQVSPEGTPWAPLSPAYKKRKHRNANKILTLRGYLAGTLRGQYDQTGLEFGTDRPYGAAQHFGAEIDRAASTREVYFRQKRDGSVGNQFVKKGKSNFAQTVNVGGYKIRIPARPWLGTNEQQNNQIVKKAHDYLQDAMGG